MAQFRLSHVMLGLVLMGALLAGGKALWRWHDPFCCEKFDGEVWKQHATPPMRESPRGAMVKDLLGRLQRGMEEKQVQELLGKPDSLRGANTYLYIVGAWSGIRLDYDALQLEFNNGKLTSARVVRL